MTLMRGGMQQFVDSLAYFLNMRRFGKEFRPAVLGDLRPDPVIRCIPAHEEDRRIGRNLVAPEGFEKMRAGGPGHMIIQQNQSRAQLPGFLQAFHRFGGPMDFMSRGLEGLSDDTH